MALYDYRNIVPEPGCSGTPSTLKITHSSSEKERFGIAWTCSWNKTSANRLTAQRNSLLLIFFFSGITVGYKREHEPLHNRPGKMTVLN